jgi:hypothetical protein
VGDTGSLQISRCSGPIAEPVGGMFKRFIGIDYSGANASTAGLRNLRVYSATVGDKCPKEERRQESRLQTRRWSRKCLAEWIVECLRDNEPSLIGIDHGFSFPRDYFERHALDNDWHRFLDDFAAHWPTHVADTWVRQVLRGEKGMGAERRGEKEWFRITEHRIETHRAKSVFDFDRKQGCVAFSTHAGLPWLRFIRDRINELGSQVHFWPFDGWDIPAGRSAIVEVYPALWSATTYFASLENSESRRVTGDQRDAYCVADWMLRADSDRILQRFLHPNLTSDERATGRFEGWILGVP